MGEDSIQAQQKLLNQLSVPPADCDGHALPFDEEAITKFVAGLTDEQVRELALHREHAGHPLPCPDWLVDPHGSQPGELSELREVVAERIGVLLPELRDRLLGPGLKKVGLPILEQLMTFVKEDDEQDVLLRFHEILASLDASPEKLLEVIDQIRIASKKHDVGSKRNRPQ